MIKTLTLLILSAIVMASVACGFIQPKQPTIDEQIKLIEAQKSVMLCQEAMDRKAKAQSHYDELGIIASRGSFNVDNLNRNKRTTGTDILIATVDIKKYCEPPTPVPTPTPNA